MAPVIVTPTELRKAAEAFKSANGLAEIEIDGMVGMLKDCGGCAGTDNAGKNWSSNFDPAASDAIDAATALVSGLGQMHDLLQATASNHANANQLSVIGGAPDDVAFPPGSIAWMQRPQIPKLYGGSSDAPSWWDKIAGFTQGEIWPNGDPEILRNAATAYSFCADQLLMVHHHQIARDAIGDQQSPEIGQVLEQITILESEAKALSENFRILAHSCGNYAQAIEDAHHQILKMLGEFAALWVATEAAGFLLTEFTFGGSLLVSNGALAARAAVIGARIANVCRTLAFMAETTGLPVIAASGAFVRSVEQLTPLLTSQASLLTAETAGLINPLSQTDLNLLARRPYLRKSTKDAVMAAADRTTVNGQEFFRSATDRNVLIPVSGKYDDAAIAQLPKDARGEYYLGPNGIRYPINSKPVFGHMPGHENWRLRDEALRANPPMTWKEYSDLYNNPKLYRIEDAPGNSRHIFEEPK